MQEPGEAGKPHSPPATPRAPPGAVSKSEPATPTLPLAPPGPGLVSHGSRTGGALACFRPAAAQVCDLPNLFGACVCIRRSSSRGFKQTTCTRLWVMGCAARNMRVRSYLRLKGCFVMETPSEAEGEQSISRARIQASYSKRYVQNMPL